MTQSISIPSDDRFGWLHNLARSTEYQDFREGLVCIQSRTGSGKSRIPLILSKIDKDAGYLGQYVLVPSNHSNLVGEHTQKLQSISEEILSQYGIECLEHDNQSYKPNELSKFKITFMEEERPKFELVIKKLDAPQAKRKMKKYFDDEIKLEYVIYLDEFHTVQTQFGLNHGGVRSGHTPKKLKEYCKMNKNNENLHFRTLEYLCRDRKLVALSGTLDDVICNDLLPYEGKFPRLNIIVNHTKNSGIPNPLIYGKNTRRDDSRD